MQALRYLDKRTFDDRLFDIVCSDLLDYDETIVSAVIFDGPTPVPALGSIALSGLVYGTPVPNPAPIIYPKLGVTAQIAKAIQVRISGGVIPDGATELLITIRLQMETTVNPMLEATVILRLTDCA